MKRRSKLSECESMFAFSEVHELICFVFPLHCRYRTHSSLLKSLRSRWSTQHLSSCLVQKPLCETGCRSASVSVHCFASSRFDATMLSIVCLKQILSLCPLLDTGVHCPLVWDLKMPYETRLLIQTHKAIPFAAEVYSSQDKQVTGKFRRSPRSL